MTKKSLIISSSGMRNIVMSKFTEEDDFIIIFGDKEFRMNCVYADFISPLISHYHHSDPTIQTIQIDNLITDKKSEFASFAADIITEDIIFLLKQISSGFPIEIDENQAFKLRFLSIILGNEELFSKINQIFPPDLTEENLNTYLQYIECCYHFSQFHSDFDFSDLLNKISNRFYSIDPDDFLRIPRPIQYSIISNPKLQIKSEDSLLDVVLQIIQKSDNSTIDDLSFLEQIEFTELSEDKLREFLSEFDLNYLNNSLWRKFYQCFFIHFDKKVNRIQSENGHSIKKEVFEYNENEANSFEGIIHFLTEKYGGNVDEKGIIKATASSIFKPQFSPQNAVDFSNTSPVSTTDKKNSWIMYDFCERKVRPTHYSIKTWNMPKGNSHLKNWVIEGSNSNIEKDWIVLDSRKDINFLDSNLAEVTFELNNKIGKNEYFRYLRLRQTGLNTRNTNQLILSSLEFFGTLI